MEKKTKKKALTWVAVFLIITGVVFIASPFIFLNFILPLREGDILSVQQELALQQVPGETAVSVLEDTAVEQAGKTDASSQDNPGSASSGETAATLPAAGSPEDPTSSHADTLPPPSVENYFPAKILIPDIEVDWTVKEGADRQTLKSGPGHIAGTPFPGQEGRSVISGHRTTYGAPFSRLDELEKGDIIYIDTKSKGRIGFKVIETVIVSPKDLYILIGSSKKQLLLTTCTPRFTATKRLIIIADMIPLS